MKKKIFASFLSFLLLTSCSSYDESALISTTREEISKITDTTKTSYTFSPLGYIIGFESYLNSDSTKTVPSGKGKAFGSSYLLRVPVRLSSESYYSDEDTSNASYGYGVLKKTLASSNDPVHFMQFKKDGDNFIFYSKQVSKSLSFYNVNVSDNINKPVNVYSRFNIQLTYNSEGLLTEEWVFSTNYKSASKKESVNVLVNYNYNE